MKFIFSIAVGIAFLPTVNLDASIIGSQVFNVDLDPNSGPLDQSFTFQNLSSNSSQGGDFLGLASMTPWGDFVLPTFDSIGQMIVISDAIFGVFTGTVVSDDLFPIGPAANARFRNVLVVGTYTPGTLPHFGGDTDMVPANLSITLNKASQTSNIGGSVTLDTNPTVPEPSSIALLGLATVSSLVMRRRRKK